MLALNTRMPALHITKYTVVSGTVPCVDLYPTAVDLDLSSGSVPCNGSVPARSTAVNPYPHHKFSYSDLSLCISFGSFSDPNIESLTKILKYKCSWHSTNPRHGTNPLQGTDPQLWSTNPHGVQIHVPHAYQMGTLWAQISDYFRIKPPLT